MNDVDDSDHELTDEQRDKLRKAIGEIIGDFTPWILCVDTTPIIVDSRVSYSSNVSSEHASVYELIGLMESQKQTSYSKEQPMTDLDKRISEYAKWIESRYDDSHELRGKGKNGYIDGKADAYESSLREFKRIFNVKEE